MVHFQNVNAYNPYLFEKQYYNRLILGTKMYILSDHFENYFGFIVGHVIDFYIKSDTHPDIKILIADSLGITPPNIHTISRWIVKNVDLHNTIGFAVPSKPPDLANFNCTINKKDERKMDALTASH